MEMLLKKIEETYDIPLEDQYDEKLELQFLQSFLKKINIDSDPLSVEKISNKEFCLAYLCLAEFREPFQELQKKVNNFHFLDYISSYKSIKDIFSLLFEFNDHNLVDHLANLSYDIDEMDNNNEDLQMIKNAGLLSQLIKINSLLKRNIGDTPEARKSFFDLLISYTDEFFDVILGISVVISIKEDIFVYRTKYEPTEKDDDVGKGLKKIMSLGIEPFTKDKLEKGKVYDLIASIREREQFLNRSIKAREKKLSTIKEKIKSISFKDTIYFTKSLLSSLPESVRYTLLEYSLIHNRNLYLKIEQELKEEEKLTILEQLFRNSYFKFSRLTDEEKKHIALYGNIESIRKMMELFSDKRFSFLKNKKFPIGDILVLSNPGIVNTISKLLNQNLISNSFVEKYPEIFVDTISNELKEQMRIKDGRFSDLLSNIDELRKRKISTNRVSNSSPSVLILDKETLKSNLELIDEYDISYGKIRNFEFFQDLSRIKFLDQFIELGLYDMIKNSPDMINQDAYKIINRIKLCIQLGIPIQNIDTLKLNSVITDETFKIGGMSISDDEVGKYVLNATRYYEDAEAFKILSTSQRKKTNFDYEPNCLSNFIENPQVYNINGVFVSRNKVISNYQTLKESDISLSDEQTIFNSIIHGGIFNSSELDSISEIFGYNNSKQKRQVI